MKKFDIIIIAVVIAAAAALYASGAFSPKSGGDEAVIYIDGDEYARLPLDEDTSLRVETDEGYNDVVIKDGYADVTEADCRDGLCVNQREISKVDETIVCLPHKVIVEVE